MSLENWFIVIGIIFLIIYGILATYNVLKEQDWEAQAYMTLILLVMWLILYVFYCWIVGVIWIAQSINDWKLAKLNFHIVFGLIMIFPTLKSTTYINTRNS